MEQGKHLVLKDDGIHEVSITTRRLKTEQQVLDILCDGRLSSIPDVFSVGGSRAHLKHAPPRYNYVTVEVPHIVLNANFEVVDDLILPKFLGKHVTPAMPLRPIWTPPGDCRLRFLVCADSLTATVCHLVAFDSSSKAYRLPLPNIFEDCKVCMGEYDPTGKNLHQTACISVDQFFGSPWNTDLLDDDRLNSSRELFRWKPSGDKLDQVYPAEHWTTYCEKVGLSDSVINQFSLL